MALGRDDLVGGWRLSAWYAEGSDGERNYPMGENAEGMIMYTPDGWVTAVIHAGARQPTSDSGTANASYFNYCGRWRLDGDAVIHTIEHALDQSIVGAEVRREIKLDGDMLNFTGAGAVDGATNIIIWQRTRD
jgi:hypothetical protein